MVKAKVFFLAVSAALISALVVNSASADWRSDAYFGAGAGVAQHDGCEGSGCDNGFTINGGDIPTNDDAGVKFFMGFRFHDFLAFETGFYDFGDAGDEGDEFFDVRGGAFKIPAILPIDEGSRLFVSGGVFYGEVQEQDSGSDSDNYDLDSGLSPIIGAGGEFRIGPMFTLRGEVEWIPNIGDGESAVTATQNPTADINMVFTSVSLVWHFLGLTPEVPVFSTGSGLSSLTGFYVGGGVSVVSFDGREERDLNAQFDDNISATKVGAKGFVGFRFHKYLAAEAAYHYFNQAHDSDVTAAGPDTFEARGSAVPFWESFPSLTGPLHLLG